MELSLFDLHCDTAGEMLAKHQSLGNNQLAVSLDGAKVFRKYTQVMAFWTNYRLDDEAGWQQMLRMRENLLADESVRSGRAVPITAFPADCPPVSLLFGIEDARIFANRIERVDEAFALGIRILTPLWAGETCIGGSHNTSAGLTPFGKQAIRRAVTLGMIPDISHASVPSADDIFEIAAGLNRPVIASHSNAHAVCPVSRNLSDAQIGSIVACGGLIGINLYKSFLRENGSAMARDVIPHVEHFLGLGAEKALCLGCDMDGADLPEDLQNVRELPLLAELLLQRNYPESLIHAIFHENAARFARRFLTR